MHKAKIFVESIGAKINVSHSNTMRSKEQHELAESFVDSILLEKMEMDSIKGLIESARNCSCSV